MLDMIRTLQSAMKAFTHTVIPRVLGLEAIRQLIAPKIFRLKITYYKSLND